MPRSKLPKDLQGTPGRKRCPQCRELHGTVCRVCPHCGWDYREGREQAAPQPLTPAELMELVTVQHQFLDRFAGSGDFLVQAIAAVRDVQLLRERWGAWTRVEEALRVTAERLVEEQRRQHEADELLDPNRQPDELSGEAG